jgi:SNF2 family DNA or RNA helicase
MSLLKQNTSSHQSVIQTLKYRMMPRLAYDYERDICQELIKEGESIESSAKFETVFEMVSTNDEQYIIYTEYLDTIAMLQKQFQSHGIPVTVYHGSMTAVEKERAIKTFKGGESRIMISSESGGQGLNLQFCHNLINYDLPWNPMKIEQRIGRVHRFGQTQPVHIYSFPVKGTIDEYLLYILAAKLNLFESVIGELDTIMSYMIKDDDNLEIQIGRIILESESTEEIEARLREIGEKAIVAREEFQKEEMESREILDDLGV